MSPDPSASIELELHNESLDVGCVANSFGIHEIKRLRWPFHERRCVWWWPSGARHEHLSISSNLPTFNYRTLDLQSKNVKTIKKFPPPSPGCERWVRLLSHVLPSASKSQQRTFLCNFLLKSPYITLHVRLAGFIDQNVWENDVPAYHVFRLQGTLQKYDGLCVHEETSSCLRLHVKNMIVYKVSIHFSWFFLFDILAAKQSPKIQTYSRMFSSETFPKIVHEEDMVLVVLFVTPKLWNHERHVTRAHFLPHLNRISSLTPLHWIVPKDQAKNFMLRPLRLKLAFSDPMFSLRQITIPTHTVRAKPYILISHGILPSKHPILHVFLLLQLFWKPAKMSSTSTSCRPLLFSEPFLQKIDRVKTCLPP